MDIVLEPADPIHLSVIITLQEAFYRIDHYPFDLSKARAVMAFFLDSPELGKLYVLKFEESIVGYLALTYCYSFEFGGRIAFLDEFYLEPAYRGRGLGSQALKQALEKARLQGINVIHLEAERHNEAGKALYHKFGFYNHDRHLLTKKLRE